MFRTQFSLLLLSVLLPVIFAGCKTNPYTYSDNWVVRQNATPKYFAEYDVFYVYPALQNSMMWETNKDSAENIFNYVSFHTTNVFGKKVRVFAPLVHQIPQEEYSAILNSPEYKNPWKTALKSGIQDTIMALRFYLENYQKEEQPFIMLGHGQGALYLYEALKYCREIEPDMGFIAAYLINGQNLSVEQIEDDFFWRDIKVARGEFDSGVIIMWRIKPLWADVDSPPASDGGYIINPLNWQTDDAEAAAELNLGANIFDAKAKVADQIRQIPGFCGARINPQTAYLELSIPEQFQYIVEAPNNLNLNGFGFFAYNIIQNAERRVRTYKFNQQWQ